MFKFLRLLLAALVLLMASAAGCVLSASEVFAWAPWSAETRASLSGLPPANIAMVFGLAAVALTGFAAGLGHRSASAKEVCASGGVLFKAMDQMQGAVVTFDREMKATDWNREFVGRFPTLVPHLEQGATLERLLSQACNTCVFSQKLGFDAIETCIGDLVTNLQSGDTVQQTVHTPSGSTFDLVLFPLAAQQYGVIWVDVTKFHHQHADITAHSRVLEQTNQQLLAFSKMAVQELKAPLRQQSALLERMSEEIADAKLGLSAEAQSQFAMLAKISTRMDLLASGLLDYTTVDLGQKKAECFSPNARLEAIVARAAIGPHIKVDIKSDIPPVHVDPVSFDLVMQHLITNAAWHHDKARGGIVLRAYRNQTDVVIEVEDDGPGIAPYRYDEMFEPFTRFSHAAGNGLGLALVKKVVTSWGGTVNLRSTLGSGSVFSVSLPAAAHPIEVLGGLPHELERNLSAICALPIQADEVGMV